MPSPDSDSSSSNQLHPSSAELARLQAQRKKDDEEVCTPVVKERKADEEDYDDWLGESLWRTSTDRAFCETQPTQFCLACLGGKQLSPFHMQKGCTPEFAFELARP